VTIISALYILSLIADACWHKQGIFIIVVVVVVVITVMIIVIIVNPVVKILRLNVLLDRKSFHEKLNQSVASVTELAA